MPELKITRSAKAAKHLPYMPGIDALRAFAVLAVFFYHAGGGWMPGGFLGVDVFFVISGYLITSLLLKEFTGEGHVNVGRFWLRRARRLLPAVGVFIAVTMIAAAIFVPEQLDKLRGDAVAGLAYVANWHFIFDHVSYFEQFQRPSLFRHIWSLAVEEQFYLLWPLLFAAGMMLLGRRRLLLGVIVGALASTVLMAVLFSPDTDPSRVFFGTDTRAVGLLVGVALALIWDPWRLRAGKARRRAPVLLDAAGAIAFGLVILSFLKVHDFDLSLYRGGFLWTALCAAVLIATLAHPKTRIGKALATPQMLWLGVRSYSFYLWHWPVLALTRPGIDVSLPRGVLIPLQLVAVLALADLSYRFVEQPFRRKRETRLGAKRWRRLAMPALAAGVLATVVLVGWAGLFSTKGSRLEGEAAASTRAAAKVGATFTTPAQASSSSGEAAAGGQRIVALGDSVMVGAKRQLVARLGKGFAMDAHIDRQVFQFLDIIRAMRDAGQLPDYLIIHMGNNGPLYSNDMNSIREAVAGIGHVFLVNDKNPVSWEGEANHQLELAAANWPQTTVIDWHSVADSTGGLLWDGLHLTPAGARAYATAIARAVKSQEAARASSPAERGR